ncbi:MAG: sugar transferase [Acidimicrobiales bacterium]
MAADLVTVGLAMVVGYRLKTHLPGNPLRDTAGVHLLVGGLSLPLWATMFLRQRLYTARCVNDPIEELRRLARAATGGIIATALLAFALRSYVSRGWLLTTFVAALFLVAAERYLVRRIFAAERRRGRLLRPVVIVGDNAEARALAAMLTDDPTLGYRVVDVLPEPPLHPSGDERARLVQVVEAVRGTRATGVIVATTAVSAGTSNRIARDLPDAGVHVELSSSLRDVARERLVVRSLGRYAMLHVDPVRRTGWQVRAKRAFDVCGASVALLLALPLLLLAGLAVRLTSPGPVLFRQERIGRGGRPFELLKLRTMVVGADAMRAGLDNHRDGPLFKLPRDPRLTPVGGWLRRTSIDELPQLWNVLRGEMSLVGPRPALAAELAAWSPELHQRLRVKPGITGMWQVEGRNDASFASYERLDLYYVDNWSLVRDLVILARTLPAVVSARGAY